MIKEFQEFRKILCVCPCCGDIVRVSDLKITAGGPAPHTWLDDYNKKCQLMQNKEDKFNEKEGLLRELARDKGRKAAEKAFNKAIIPGFKKLKYDPFDIKPVLNPIDFIIFKDMNKKETVNDIVFLSKICKNTVLNGLRNKVKKAITAKKYDWQVARIGVKGEIAFE